MSAASREAALAAAREAGVVAYVDASTRKLAAQDFGGVVSGRCLLATEPANAEAAARLLASLDARGVGCTLRGTGYGQGGQSVALDTVSISTRRLDWIGAPDLAGKTITAGSGATLRRVLQVLEPSGLVPPALPLNLDMSLGGLLSAGGIGPSSHRHGPVIANVSRLSVATASGEVRSCSREQEPDLFDAVLGGVGQCGLITDVTLSLRRAPTRMRVVTLFYSDISRFLQDKLRASQVDEDLEIEGYCWASAKGLRAGAAGSVPFTQWMYGLHLAFDVDAASRRPVQELLSSLQADRRLDEYETDLSTYLQRYEPRFVGMVDSGAWNEPHPWFEGLVPSGRLEEFLGQTLPTLPPEVGDGHRLMLVDTDRATSMFRGTGGQLAVVGIFPVAFARTSMPRVLALVERLTSLALEVGGRRYLSGWLGSNPGAYLRAHFGERHEAWTALRRRYDPRGTFRSALFPTGHTD